jgi:hypothetical protein
MRLIALKFALVTFLIQPSHANEAGSSVELIQGGGRSGSVFGSFKLSSETDLGASLSSSSYPGGDRGDALSAWTRFYLGSFASLKVQLGSSKSPDLARALDLGLHADFEVSEFWGLSFGFDRTFSFDSPGLSLSAGSSFAPDDDWTLGLELSATRALDVRSKRKRRPSLSLRLTPSGTERTDFSFWASRTLGSKFTLGVSLTLSKVRASTAESILEIGTNASYQITETWALNSTVARSKSTLVSLPEWAMSFGVTYSFTSAKDAEP